MTTAPASQPHTAPDGGAPLHHAGAKPLTRTQKVLTGIVVGAVLVIATLGFIGSYAAVTELAARKGFGDFAGWFPVSVDAGIIAFLALDLLLTWRRIPFPLLRHTAWGLTGATIAFNAATAWPDWLGVGMHATTPVLFVIAVEAARHAVGRIADITADKYIESPPFIRWFLDPFGTFRIWRRQRLWQIRSYETVIRIERDAAMFRRELVARHGRRWRKRAERHEVLALFNVRYGMPVADSLARHEAGAGGATVSVERDATKALWERHVQVPVAATERPALSAGGATADATERHATDDATRYGRHESAATVAPRHDATHATGGRHEDATERHATHATQVTPRRHERATASATVAPRRTPQSATGPAGRSAAKTAIRDLYDTLGRRPLEPEMVTELKRIGSKHTSRQFAGKVRRELERENPSLAALGTDNVRALTGTDG